MANVKHYSGERFGDWTVLSLQDGSWLCRHSCGAVRRLRSTQMRETARCYGCKKESDVEILILQRSYSMYQSNARSREIFWGITYELFSRLLTKPCFYCLRIPDQRKRLPKGYAQGKHHDAWLLTNGLDRVDNQLGYQPGNVVPCCKVCNGAKSNLSIAQWIELITLCYNRMNTIKEKILTHDEKPDSQ